MAESLVKSDTIGARSSNRLLNKTLLGQNTGQNSGRPPIWLMRQAGRYHNHYQNLKKTYTFLELCKSPDLACEVTMGPIRDFDFDAAILFSDILFPLEAAGVPLDFAPGPKLGFHLREASDLSKYKTPDVNFMQFQAEALTKIRAALPQEKALIGFVGSPLTLYFFAVEGSHKGDISSALSGMTDGRFEGFMELMANTIADNMILQATAGEKAEGAPDVIAMFDSCAGEIPLEHYKTLYLPYLTACLKRFKAACPDMPVIYYGKNAGPDHWQLLTDLPIDVLGVDHTQNLPEAAQKLADRFVLQGNLDPDVMTLSPAEATPKIEAFLESMAPYQDRWICGLGHGVTPKAQEATVKLFVEKVQAL